VSIRGFIESKVEKNPDKPFLYFEDEVMACIVLKENQMMNPEEIIDWCRDHLANFKVPRYVQFRDSLPKTPTQRIAKYILKQEEDLIELSYDMESYKKKIGL